MPGPNQKHTLPRFPGQGGYLFSRGRFLDGTAKCYFGPGQDQSSFFNYVNPNDWPKSGTLLRVPRTVWLQSQMTSANVGVPGSFSVSWRNMYYDQRYSPISPTRDFNGVPVYYGDGPYTTVWPNANKIEHDRIIEAFVEAKTRIESIQPGRTWVKIVDWNGTGVSFGNGYFSDGFLQFAAPGSVAEPFLGTDFLHVWAGHAFYNNFGNINNHVTNPMFPYSQSEDRYYNNPRARLINSHEKFRGHRTVLFSSDAQWEPVGTRPAPDAVLSETGFYPYDTVNDQINQDTIDMFDYMASDLAGYNFSHAGGSSAITAESLVALIADHFGFDPVSGADIA